MDKEKILNEPLFKYPDSLTDSSNETARTNLPILVTNITRNLSQFAGKDKQISISDYIGAGEEFNVFELPDKKIKLIIKGIGNKENELILPTNFTVGANKILKTAMVLFTQINSKDNLTRNQFNLDVTIPLKEYARLCNKDIDPNPDAPDQTKEKARTRRVLSKFRTKTREDLRLIVSSSFDTEQRVGNKTIAESSINFLGNGTVTNNYIHVEFTKSFARFLLEASTINRFSQKLLGIDERNINAFALGESLTYHFSSYKFQGKGNHDRRVIKKLLDDLPDLPTYEEVLANGYSWRYRIKKPFENAITELKRAGLITKWHYGNNKDKKITKFADFEQWQNSKLFFEIADKEEVLKPKKEEKK